MKRLFVCTSSLILVSLVIFWTTIIQSAENADYAQDDSQYYRYLLKDNDWRSLLKDYKEKYPQVCDDLLSKKSDGFDDFNFKLMGISDLALYFDLINLLGCCYKDVAKSSDFSQIEKALTLGGTYLFKVESLQGSLSNFAANPRIADLKQAIIDLIKDNKKYFKKTMPGHDFLIKWHKSEQDSNIKSQLSKLIGN